MKTSPATQNPASIDRFAFAGKIRRVFLTKPIEMASKKGFFMNKLLFRLLSAAAFISLLSITEEANAQSKGIWISATELANLPASGPAWDNLRAEADRPTGVPDLSNQDDPTNVRVLAKALVYARTKQETYRTEVINACMAAINTEDGGRTLALARELAAYVIAADLVVLPPDKDQVFKAWLRSALTKTLDSKTLQSTHEERGNNWGTNAGGARAAVAVYLGDQAEIERTAKVFKGWLGDRASYAGFKFGDLSWQANPSSPIGINPRGATKDGHSIDGVLPDDQRRAGGFKWPPPKENYVYGALQGVLVQANILHRVGYDTWNWGDKAILRAFQWTHFQANFPPSGDDTWVLPLVDRVYGSSFWNGSPTSPGKSMGWTDWTHGKAGGGGTGAINQPLNFSAVAKGTQVTISWFDNSVGEDGFRIERRDGVNGEWIEISITGPDVGSRIDTGLQPGSTYYYRVRAFKGTEFSPYSDEDNVLILTPPNGLRAEQVSG
ncbi:MAG: alginate lyase family protein [Anaerolineae bacterium]|nr:alginate lyase family protein [Anaerolineae bacterium]